MLDQDLDKLFADDGDPDPQFIHERGLPAAGDGSGGMPEDEFEGFLRRLDQSRSVHTPAAPAHAWDEHEDDEEDELELAELSLADNTAFWSGMEEGSDDSDDEPEPAVAVAAGPPAHAWDEHEDDDEDGDTAPAPDSGELPPLAMPPVAQEEAPAFHVAARRGIFAGPNALSIINPNMSPTVNELGYALAAFSQLREGQRGFIRFSVRPAPQFKSEAQAWMTAVKTGQPTEPEETGLVKKLISWGHYFSKLVWHEANKDSKYLGGSAPPSKPGQKVGDVKPIPRSLQDEDTVEALENARKKVKAENAHFDVGLWLGAVGAAEDKDDLERIVDDAALGFDVYRTPPYQEIVFQPDHPLHALRGMMLPEGANKMILSAAELGMIAAIPDDTLQIEGVNLIRSKFKQLPPLNPTISQVMSKAYQANQDLWDKPELLGKVLGKAGVEQGLVPLGIINPKSEDGRVVCIPIGVMNTHMFWCGQTGSGKSELMKWVIYGCAKADYPVVVIDPHGVLSEDLLRGLIVNCPERINDIVLCDLGDPENPVALNPLDIASRDVLEPTVKSVMEMLAKQMQLDKGGAPRAARLAQLALTALAEANLYLQDPDVKCTLLHVIPFFTDTEFRQLIVSLCDNIAVSEMFDPDGGPFENLNEKQQTDMCFPIIRAFQDLSSSDSFAAVFSSSENRLNFSKLIKQNKIILIKLAAFHTQAELGEFIGALVLPYLLTSLGDWGRQPLGNGQFSGRGCRVFVDEAPRLLGPDSAAVRILAEARKWDLGLAFASQFLTQFDKTVLESTLNNTATKLSLKLDPAGSQLIAKSIAGTGGAIGPNDIASLPKYHFYGTIAESGAMSAACLPPLYCTIDDEGTKQVERVVSRSRLIVANRRADVETKKRSSRESIKAALTVLNSQKADAADRDMASGSGFALDLDSDDLWDT